MAAPPGKRQRVSPADQAEALALESFLFGQDKSETLAATEDKDPFAPAIWEDRQGSVTASYQQPAQQPAWEDEQADDTEVNIARRNQLRKLRQSDEETVLEGSRYEQRLRQQHGQLHQRTSWASRRPAHPADLLTGSGPLLDRSAVLAPGLLEVTRVKDANRHEPSKSVVRSVEFHPAGQLLLTAGLDKHLRIFQVDGVHNQQVQSVVLEDMPIYKAAYACGGSQVVVAGRRKYFYVLDVQTARIERVLGPASGAHTKLQNFVTCPAAASPLLAFLGSDGHMPLLSLRSRQAVGDLKMNGTVRSAAFSADGLELLTSGGDGVLHVWDIRMQRCMYRYVDEGCLNGVSLAWSPDSRLFASGSDSGVVNLYKRAGQASNRSLAARPLPAVPLQPERSFMHLTTAVDSLAFNSDAQLLAIASRMKKDALRLVHVPSRTVFANWPTSRTPLNYIHSLCFSPDSSLLALGNAKGHVLLYRLHHYG